jgi:hypothetical protein
MFLPTCPLKLQTGNLALRNWVRFARFAPRPGHAPHGNRLCPHTPVTPSLASFCTISVGKCEVRGLKSEGGMAGPSDLALETSNSKLDTSKLGSFRTFDSRRHHAPHAGLCPNVPFPPSLALFCAFTARPEQNWVRFARFDPRIGFVLHDHSPAGIAARRPAPVSGRAGPIGFVLHYEVWRGQFEV